MTTLSGSSLPFVKGFDDYISSASAHDQDRPGGPSARVEYMSTLGDCRPETFVGDMLRTRLAYGKGDLEIDAYSYVLSHSHEELDPADDSLGAVAHGLARDWAREAWPGRQVKIVTQRDNGRWEGEGDDRAWVDGHWHSHIVVANVAEQEVALRWRNADGKEFVKSYPAGRAIDGDLKNVFRLRHQVDDVVLREWRYDNAAYVEACRKFSEGAAAKQDLAQRAERGYSTYDQVRLKLRTAAAQADSWDDYVARCQAVAVDVRVRGKSGVSYSWVGDDGLERKARARGKSGVGPEFAKAEVESRCAENAAAIERGQVLDVPEQALVVPTSTVAPDRPKPVYLTEDGMPPWADDQALEAYAAQVRESGGTYEGLAAQAAVADGPVEGVALDVRSHTRLVETVDADGGRRVVDKGLRTEITATVDAGAGPLVLDVDEAVVKRRAELEQWQKAALAEVEAEHTELMGEVIAERQAIDAEVEQAVAKAVAEWEANEKPGLVQEAWDEGWAKGHDNAELMMAGAKTQADKLVADARAEAAGIRTAARKDGLVEAKEILDNAKDDREAAKKAREAAEAAQRAAQERLDAIPEYDPQAAVQAMQAARYDAGERRTIPIRMKDGTVRDIKANAVLDNDAKRLYEKRNEPVPNQTIAERSAEMRDRMRGGQKDLNQASRQSQARDQGMER